ncbi:MAG: glycoside hydrolase family 97 N-terminal domain-containing protein, partial [Burkholderiaceae bacterium]
MTRATSLRYLGTATLMAMAVSAHAADPILESPDRQIEVGLRIQDGELRYTVQRLGESVLLPSQLGLALEGAEWRNGLKLAGCGTVTSGRERYALIGKRSVVDEPYRAVTCRVMNARGQTLRIDWRAFDGGVAFRYQAADKAPVRKRFKEELTSFRFDAGARAWLQPMQVAQTGWMNTNPAYEEHYRRDIPVGEASPSPAGWVFPALFRSGPATWIALTEAGMDGRFHASRLQSGFEGGEYRMGQPMAAEIFPGGGLLADVAGTLTTPWRVIALGPLPSLMASTLGTDLAAPAVKFPADRLKPGPASWSWALLKDDGTVYDVQQRFIDYAADMGWPYTLIDADWDRKIGWERIQTLAAYAKGKGVGLWLWYNSSGAWNKTEYTPKSALIDAGRRRAEFARLSKAGIRGLKIDFFGGDGQSMIRYYVDILNDAAAAGLLINFHGATLPRGWARTYPHLMT